MEKIGKKWKKVEKSGKKWKKVEKVKKRQNLIQMMKLDKLNLLSSNNHTKNHSAVPLQTLVSLCTPLLNQLIKTDTNRPGRKIHHQKCQNLIYLQMHQMMDPKMIQSWMMHYNHPESPVLITDSIILISKSMNRRWLMHALRNFTST